MDLKLPGDLGLADSRSLWLFGCLAAGPVIPREVEVEDALQEVCVRVFSSRVLARRGPPLESASRRLPGDERTGMVAGHDGA